jgi:MFS family permease
LFLLVYALVRGNDKGWGSSLIIGCLVAAAVLMIAFFVNERLTPEPMLDLGLFKIPAFVGVSIVAFAIAASIFAMFLYLTLYIQDDLGFGPLPAGIKFLPLTLLAFLVAPFAGRLTVRVQSRYLMGLGMLLITGGLLAMATTTPTSAWTVLLPGFILCGIGIGTVNPVLASGAISVVQPQHSGMASGANNTFRQVGIATGIAVLGAVFQSQIITHTSAALNKTAEGVAILHRGGSQLRGALSAGQVQAAAQHVPGGARSVLTSAYHQGFSTTLNHLMVIAAIVAFVGAVGALTLVRQRDFVIPGSPGAPAPSAAGQLSPEDVVVPAVHA